MQTSSHYPVQHHPWKTIEDSVRWLFHNAFVLFVIVYVGLMVGFCSVLVFLKYLFDKTMLFASSTRSWFTAK